MDGGIKKFYGDSVTIPKAGIIKAYSTVKALVVGKNFTAPDVAASPFSVSCVSKSYIASGRVVTVESDSRLTVSLNIPDAAGEYTVTFSSGSESIEGTITVKDYSAYIAGQIVLADRTLVERADYTAIDTSNPPVAVVASFNENGAPLAVGLHTSGTELQWTPSGTTGYNTNFTDILCTSSNTGSYAIETATFSGDTDGSDNWSVICKADPEGSKDVAANYPAFNWANTYASVLGSATEGWYLSSLAELCYVYRNRDTINATLSVINRLDSTYARSSLGTSTSSFSFLTSSQAKNGTTSTWYVYSNGYLSTYSKNNDGVSLAVRVL